MRKKFFIFLWILFLMAVGAVGYVFYGIFQGAVGYMPELQNLENPVNRYASQILSADGVSMGTWSYSKENRVFVSYEDLAPSTVQALVATEDVRFYEHSGIDFKAVFRAVIKTVVMGQKSAGGGSTITQQLAKQLYSPTASSLKERALQKPIEWVIALKLERLYTKEEIINLYLNKFDFLYNAVGIRTAAKTYFNKDQDKLSVLESATLVGMCKNPSYYNPRRFKERCLERRNIVLDQMVKASYLDKAEAEELKLCPIELDYQPIDHKLGIAAYLREYLRQVLMAKEPKHSDYASWQKQQFYDDSVAWNTNPLYGWCNKNINRHGLPYNIYTDGLKVHTTIDSRMQKYAEEAMLSHVVGELQPAFEKEQKNNKNRPYSSKLSADKVSKLLQRAVRQSERYLQMKKDGFSDSEIDKAFKEPIEMTVYSPKGDIDTLMSPFDSIKYYKNFLRSGFMCMDNETGHVKAYVGGINYSHFQYDMVTQGRRQVGSTIKPYLYSLAMENGYSPCDEAPNVQTTYELPTGQTWTPRNGSKSHYGEMVTLKWGLAQSNNWISAWLMNRLSPAALVRLLHDFGIQNQEIHPSLSLCLGPCDISVYEMVGAYSAFPKKGVRHIPTFVTRIEDNDGNILAEFAPRVREVISEESSYKMLSLMRGVMDGGTGIRMRYRYKINAPMGGKTGTTNDNSDGWFVGYTPRLTFGAWVGGEERDIHFSSMAIGQGANASLPIVANFLTKVYADSRLGYTQNDDFDVPANFAPCSSIYEDEDPELIEEVGEAGLDELTN